MGERRRLSEKARSRTATMANGDQIERCSERRWFLKERMKFSTGERRSENVRWCLGNDRESRSSPDTVVDAGSGPRFLSFFGCRAAQSPSCAAPISSQPRNTSATSFNADHGNGDGFVVVS
jgi:hypothetical protein